MQAGSATNTNQSKLPQGWLARIGIVAGYTLFRARRALYADLMREEVERLSVSRGRSGMQADVIARGVGAPATAPEIYAPLDAPRLFRAAVLARKAAFAYERSGNIDAGVEMALTANELFLKSGIAYEAWGDLVKSHDPDGAWNFYSHALHAYRQGHSVTREESVRDKM